MTRTCPICGASGPPDDFPRVAQEHAPPRHDEIRRRCLRCGTVRAAWTFSTVTRRMEADRPSRPRRRKETPR